MTNKIEKLREEADRLMREAEKLEIETRSEFHFGLKDINAFKKLSDAIQSQEHSPRIPMLAQSIDCVHGLLEHLIAEKTIESWAAEFPKEW